MLEYPVFLALAVGILLAIASGPVGSIMLWKRLAYFGDALAHSALLGVAFSILISIDLMIGIFIVCVVVSLAMSFSRSWSKIPGDAMLGILSHSSLAIGLVSLAMVSPADIHLEHLLFGDIKKISPDHLFITGAVVVAILVTLIWQWRSLISLTISEEVAKAEKISHPYSEFIFMLTASALVAIATSFVGALLIGALLIIPASCARLFAKSPEQMAVVAIALGVISVSLGLGGAVQLDLPPGPAMVVACLVVYLCGLAFSYLRPMRKPLREEGE